MSPASTQTTAVTTQIEVIEFLSRELAMDKSKIWPSSRLRQDLKVDGADAMQLVAAFSVTFDVDTEDFRFTDNFGEKPQPQWVAFVLWLFGNGQPLKTLTVQNLIHAALLKKLL